MSKTALLIIDMQKDFTLPTGRVFRQTTADIMEPLLENMVKFREKGVEIFIVYTAHDKDEYYANPELSRMFDKDGKKISLVQGSGGDEIDDRIMALYDPQQDTVWRKYAPSAFFKTNLDEVLREKGIENVLVCGVKTNVCVRATCVDSNCHGFRTFVITDMTATNTKELNEFHFKEFSKYFAKAIDSQEVLRRLDEGRF